MLLADLRSRCERAGNAKRLGADGMYYTGESTYFFERNGTLNLDAIRRHTDLFVNLYEVYPQVYIEKRCPFYHVLCA